MITCKFRVLYITVYEIYSKLGKNSILHFKRIK